MSVVIGRPVNGIWLNELEYCLTERNVPMVFDNEAKAKAWLSDHGIEGDDLDDCFVYQELTSEELVEIANMEPEEGEEL